MIGSHLVERLLAEKIEVRAFVQAQSDARYLESLPVELVRGDLRVPEEAASAVDGSDWVFHVAGHLSIGCTFGHSPDGVERYMQANVVPTAALLRASADADVCRFVYVSSGSVYDLAATPSPIGESAPLRPVSDYGRSKALAEELVLSFGEELETTIVRPTLVYGKRDRYFVPSVLQLARLPLLPLVDGGRHLVDIVAAADVAQLLWLAAGSPTAAGRVYNVASGAPLPLRRLVAELGELVGRRLRTYSIRPSLLRVAAPLGRSYLRAFSDGTEELLTPTGIALMAHDIYFDIRRAREELAYTPTVGLSQGLASALAGHTASGSS